MVRGAMKDKNKPKGPMSAYACFVQVIREEHKKKHPEEQVVFSEFSKKCAEKWKQMTPKEKKRFDDMAQMDKDRFNREMVDYIPADGIKRGKKRKRPKDPMMPKRAWSAFFFFCDEFRPPIREAHPEWKVGDVAKELGRMWEQCTDKEKHEARAQADKKRYEEDMLEYKAGTFVPNKRPKPDGAGPSAAPVIHDDHEDDVEEEDEDEEDGIPVDGALAPPPEAPVVVTPVPISAPIMAPAPVPQQAPIDTPIPVPAPIAEAVNAE